jgi:hypothetical protein
MKRVFELLVVYDQEDPPEGLPEYRPGEKALDYSIELLENVLRKKSKPLLPLLEDTSLEELRQPPSGKAADRSISLEQSAPRAV